MQVRGVQRGGVDKEAISRAKENVRRVSRAKALR